MPRSDSPTSVLSPALLLGFASRPIPLPVLQAVASVAMAAIRRRHTALFERLQDLENPVFLIDPLDMPFRFWLSVALPTPRLVVLGADQDPPETPAATIRGPLPALIELLEGDSDGDALFFSRRLIVEGDMAAVVALRNAVDGAEISLIEDLTRPLGPFGGPLRGAARVGGALYRRAAADMDMLREAFLAPATRRGDAQARQLHELEETVSMLGSAKRGRRA